MALSWKCHWMRHILTQDDALKFTKIRIHIIMFKPPDSSIRVQFQDITEYLSVFMFITYMFVISIVNNIPTHSYKEQVIDEYIK